jgi:hypothetical protein
MFSPVSPSIPKFYGNPTEFLHSPAILKLSKESFRVKKGGGFSMAKTYVIDTNVLIQAPNALHCFEENQLVLPLVVWKSILAN